MARKLIDRSMSDENFAHTVTLVGMCAAWAEGLRDGDTIGSNDGNMAAIPVEIALAFMKEHAKEDTELGTACRKSFEFLELMRATYRKKRTSRRPPTVAETQGVLEGY